MVKLKSLVLENDVKRLASMLGFKEFAVKKFIDKYKDLDADDLIDVIEASKDRRRSSLMVMAAMNHNRRALKQLDNLARRYIELFGYNSDNFYSDINSSGIIQVPTNPYISLSDKTIEKIDENVVKLNKWAIINALKILKKNKNIMIDLANELITNREVSKLYLDKYNITYY